MVRHGPRIYHVSRDCDGSEVTALCGRDWTVDKSTRGQRKHSFETNVDFAYIIPLFQFSRYIRDPFQKSRYGNSPKKRFGLTSSVSVILVRSIGTVTPIGPVLFHHAYIGPVLVIPPRLFRGRDHLFTILPQHFLYHVPTAPATLLLKTVFFTGCGCPDCDGQHGCSLNW